MLQEAVGWELVCWVLLPFIALVFMAVLWLKFTPGVAPAGLGGHEVSAAE
jgi:hypothetical protein